MSLAAGNAKNMGIDAVLEEMRRHARSAKLQEKGCKALASLLQEASKTFQEASSMTRPAAPPVVRERARERQSESEEREREIIRTET